MLTPSRIGMTSRRSLPDLRADRLLQLGGDLGGIAVDGPLVAALDEDAHLRLGATVTYQHAPVRSQLLLHVADGAHHGGRRAEPRLVPDAQPELRLGEGVHARRQPAEGVAALPHPREP